VASEAFESRVRELRDTWAEQRELSNFAGGNDFDSRFQLLTVLYGWALEAVKAISSVYGEDFLITVSPVPLASAQPPAFSVTIARGYSARFFLKERQAQGSNHWTVGAAVATPGSVIATTTVGPDRRHRGWSHGQVEEILLSMLAAYERDEVEGPRPKANGRRPLWAVPRLHR